MENRINDGRSMQGGAASRWNALTPAAKAGVLAVALVVGFLLVTRIFPMLIAGMGVGLLIAILFVPYWIPTIIAFMRKHPSKGAILVVNFFFGWTFIGWVISLVWALGAGASVNQQTVVVHNTVMSSAGASSSPPPPPARIGDVVNGHRFDGMTWVPLHPSAPAPLPVQEGRDRDMLGGHALEGHSRPSQQPALPAQTPRPEQSST